MTSRFDSGAVRWRSTGGDDDSAAPGGCNHADLASTFVGRAKLLEDGEGRDFRRFRRLDERDTPNGRVVFMVREN